jgi:heterodisulfide reductase subunit A2
MEECKIGVYVCNCGSNISHVVDVEEVRRQAQELDGVAIARTYRYMCSNPGQETIIRDIVELGLNRVVVSACSPRMHERTFRNACAAAGLNPYLCEMANIREQCSWVHSDTRAATEKAYALTRGAVARVLRQYPLEGLTAEMIPATLVIGGGMAGLTAALELADGGYPVFLVEAGSRLGGNLARVDLTAPHLDSARDLLTERISRVLRHSRITLLMNSQLTGLSGFVGNFSATVEKRNGSPLPEQKRIDIGNVVVATGYQEFDARRIAEYGYGMLPNVITSFEFERMLRTGRIETKDGRIPQYAVILHCVGSRSSEFHGYCSRVCCMTALKYAQELKSAVPDCYVSDVYIDMHAFGKGCEDFYRKGAEIKTMFLMFDKMDRPFIRKAGAQDDCDMLIEVQERLSGERIEIPADLVILMVGMEARSDATEVARLVNISQDKDGWFMESHPKLDPVATTTEGIYIAGACAAPKDVPDTVAQARAAAARILGRIAKGRIEIQGVFAEVDEQACSGCRMCNELCPYSAIDFCPETRCSRIIPAACKACGACVAACPSGAITGRHFTTGQILAQLEGVLG